MTVSNPPQPASAPISEREVNAIYLGLMAVLAFAVLAWAMETAKGYWVIEPAIFFLGLVMPNMTIAVQNALPLSRRGVGTAMLAFFRSLGGLLGVTASGAILAHQLHGQGRAWRQRRAAVRVVCLAVPAGTAPGRASGKQQKA